VVIAVLVGLLAALALGRTTRALRPGFRRGSASQLSVPGSRRSAPEYSTLLDAIARQVRSGSSLTGAVLAEVTESSSLGDVAEAVRAGVPLAAALAAVEPRDHDLALTIQALLATAHLGGPIAATLDEAASVLRERAAARAERLAHSAQARLSARVLTIVPIGFAGWSALASERTRDAYLSNAAGAVCAIVGLALNAAGWRWMKRIVGAT
jgi:tight adherence protein B